MEKKLTRAEQRALEKYPVNMTPLNYQDLIEQFGGKTEIDVNTYSRCLFQEGYEQAEKHMIRTVKTWLSEIHRVCDITDENGYRVELRNLVASFEKTMEEE